MRSHIAWFVTLGLLLASAYPASARKWTDKTGNFSVEADLVHVKDGKAILKKTDGKVIAVPLDRLSAADRRYLATLNDSPTKEPVRPAPSTTSTPSASAESEKQTAADPVATLIKALSSADAPKRQQAARALGRMRQKAKPAVPALVEALEDKDAGVRTFAAAALARIGSPEAKAAVPVLIEVFTDKTVDAKEPNLRGLAGVVLRGVVVKFPSEAKAVIPVLIEALEDQNRSVRASAAQTLAGMGPQVKEATPMLIEMLKKQGESRAVAATVLAGIGPDAKAAVPVLVKALMDETHANLQRKEAEYRKGRGYAPSRDSASYGLRNVLIKALEAIAPEPSEAVPTLVPALVIAKRKDPHMGLSKAATNALKKIYPLALEFVLPCFVR